MRQGDLKVWTEEWDGTPVVAAEGEIDLGTVHALRAAASEIVRLRPAAVIFDLRKVSFIDSSGLGILVATRKQLGGSSDAVTVVTDQPAVLQSLQITGLDRVLIIERSPVKHAAQAS
ncbi:MAG: anti-anti-sigma factor [Armatimonadetes bacterium]|jgi:anti-anti-sigma factor|nr:anti-anti-sigma factor [Armatimonadota bacterium]